MRLELTALSLCAALTALSMQSPPPPSERSPAPRKPVGDTLDQMEGCWKLLEMRAKQLPVERRDHNGYCVVSGIYMSLEIHVGWSGPANTVTGIDLSTGTHRIDLIGPNQITTSSLIGSFFNKENQLVFEPPGKTRKFEVDVTAGRMTLRRDDGNTYVFEKLGSARERKDFYGRVIKDKPKDAPTPPKDDKNE